MVDFGAAVAAQQLSAVEAHGTEVLVLHWGWGPLLGSRGSRQEPVFFRRGTLQLRGPRPGQRLHSDLSSPQIWGLADLGEKMRLSWREGGGVPGSSSQPSPGNVGTACSVCEGLTGPGSRGQQGTESGDRNRAKATTLPAAARKERP